MHAEVCPVCCGRGTVVGDGFCICCEEACRGCSGLGWIQVSDEVLSKYYDEYYSCKEEW